MGAYGSEGREQLLGVIERRAGLGPGGAETHMPPGRSGRYAHNMTEPRRVLIDADFAAGGLWWVSTKEELEDPTSSDLTREQQPGKPHHSGALRLSQELRDDLKAWNRSWDDSYGFWESDEARRGWEEQGRELAIQVQNELGTDGWEVLYQLGGRVHRVEPPGSWPAETWTQDLLGYPPPDAKRVKEEIRVIEGLQKDQQESGYTHPDARELAEAKARLLEWLRHGQQETAEESSPPSEP